MARTKETNKDAENRTEAILSAWEELSEAAACVNSTTATSSSEAFDLREAARRFVKIESERSS